MAQASNNTDLLNVEMLSYTYLGADTPTIKDINISLSKGSIFGLLGPSGAGKSTIQKILTRQIRRFDCGSIFILGKDINQWKHDFYEKIGVGFELPNHYLKLTALENLKLFSSFYNKDTLEPQALLDLVGLGSAANMRVSEYSKGMQIRLNFARAILHDPEILFLDEPTSGLDPTTAAHIRSVISELRDQGKAIVLTTHNMHDAEALCDRIGILSSGEMCAVDSPQALKLKYGKKQVDVTVEINHALRTQTFPLENLGENSEFLTFIQSRAIHTIHSQEASLDSVFQIVTGQTLRET